VGRAHGVRGEVYVDLYTDRTERLDVGARLQCDGSWLEVASARRLPQRWLVRFAGLDDRDAAEVLTGRPLLADPLPPRIDDDALWVHDLIGSRVVEVSGADRGTCTAVVDNPAHLLLELASGDLVPVTFVVGCADGVTTIDPPAGLFD